MKVQKSLISDYRTDWTEVVSESNFTLPSAMGEKRKKMKYNFSLKAANF